MRGKCLAQEQNTISPARAQAWTAQSGLDCTNHEDISLATVLVLKYFPLKILVCQTPPPWKFPITLLKPPWDLCGYFLVKDHF